MRKLAGAELRRGYAYITQHVQGPTPGDVVGCALVDADSFGNLVAYGENRIESGARILKYHRDAPATQVPKLPLVEEREVAPVEDHFTSVLYLPGRVYQTED
jgi:hypothetical protein